MPASMLLLLAYCSGIPNALAILFCLILAAGWRPVQENGIHYALNWSRHARPIFCLRQADGLYC